MTYFAVQSCLRQGSQFWQLSPKIVHFRINFSIPFQYLEMLGITTLYLLCVYGAPMSLLTALLGSPLVGESTKPPNPRMKRRKTIA